MKNSCFIIAILFSLGTLADHELPSHYGRIGKCDLWKTRAGNGISGVYIHYYMNLASDPPTYSNDAIINDTNFIYLKEAAKIHPKCEFDKTVTCDFDKGKMSTIKQAGCGDSFAISPVICKSGDGPNFRVMVACTVKPGQKVNPTKCYNAKAGENGGDALSLPTKGVTR